MADLASYDASFLACRDIRHAWRTMGWFYAKDSFGQVCRRRLRCDRCGTVRTDTLSGLQPKRTYEYADEYHLPKTPLSEIRGEVMARAHVYESEEALDAEVTATGRKRRKAS